MLLQSNPSRRTIGRIAVFGLLLSLCLTTFPLLADPVCDPSQPPPEGDPTEGPTCPENTVDEWNQDVVNVVWEGPILGILEFLERTLRLLKAGIPH